MRKMLSILAMTAALGAFVPAGAQTVEGNLTATRPTGLQGVLLEEGYRAKLTADPVGDPMISTASGGYEFDIIFYDCTDNTDCRSIQFFARFTGADNGSLESLNQWNSAKRYANAYVAEDGDLVLTMDVTTEGEGIGRAVFIENLALWESLMSDFAGYIWD